MTPELAKLLDQLRAIFASESQMGAAAARNRQAAALVHMTNFMESSGLERSYRNEMMQLVNALNDLNEGTIAPLLQPVPVSNRPNDTTDIWLGRTRVAVVFELLTRAGHSRKSAIEFIDRRDKYISHLLTNKTKSAGTTAYNWYTRLRKRQINHYTVFDTFVNGLNHVNDLAIEGISIEEANEEADRMLKTGELIGLSLMPG